MKLFKEDMPLLRKFLEREADDYIWKPETKYRHRHEFVASMSKDIEHLLVDVEAANYVCIQSISYMGLVDRELKLTGRPWTAGVNVYLMLPPSPRGKVGITVK